MPTSLISTGVQFPDNSVQTTAVTSAGGDYVLNAYTTPATWTKPAGLKAVKVTVVGGGGSGGPVTSPAPVNNAGGGGGGGAGGGAIEYLDAPAIPGPVAVTAGAGTNSFGGFLSATGGTAGGTASVPPAGTAFAAGGAGGAGSGGQINLNGEAGQPGSFYYGAPATFAGYGGDSVLGVGYGGAGGGPTTGTATSGVGAAGSNFGSGGGGGGRGPGTNVTRGGGAGAPGIVIVEEFY